MHNHYIHLGHFKGRVAAANIESYHQHDACAAHPIPSQPLLRSWPGLTRQDIAPQDKKYGLRHHIAYCLAQQLDQHRRQVPIPLDAGIRTGLLHQISIFELALPAAFARKVSLAG